MVKFIMEDKLLKKEQSTDKIILQSAREVFMKSGLQGARMQEIADKASINKAMLYYYYRSKEDLFKAVFIEEIYKVMPKISELLAVDLPLFDKIRYFVENYIDIIKRNKHMPIFVLTEINQNPERIVSFAREKVMTYFHVLVKDVEKAYKEGLIIKIEPQQLIVNMLALCLFPFAARPMVKGIFGMDEDAFDEFIDRRKKEVPDFIINAIKVK
ncbi:MAG: TetR/AcrR family transcriptional regulator [Ignavibacteriae bacterium]|nr:TetR/AcrR family transcriptional regulator [Ignavibacteriota bacterium]MCB9244233.1 TetR/AcrR family transcriptional regulator [Ignavibacteriales bacterium]